MRTILKSAKSRKDYLEIWTYVAERSSPDTADRLLDKFDAALEMLADHPRAGADRSEIRRRFRSYPVGVYLMF